MDDIEQFLLQIADEFKPEAIDRYRGYLSDLNKEAYEKEKTNLLLAIKFRSNTKGVVQEQENEWEKLRRNRSSTSVLVYIYNFTNEIFSLTHSSSATNEPGKFAIPAGDYMSFALPGQLLKRINNGKVGHQFTYRSGDYAFKFATASQLSPTYEPFAFETTTQISRQHSIHSIGQKEIMCQYRLDQSLSTSPYSYAISIDISYPFQ